MARRFHSPTKCTHCDGRVHHSFAVRDEGGRLYCDRLCLSKYLKKTRKQERWEKRRSPELLAV